MSERDLTATSLAGVRVSVMQISDCVYHGNVPHRVGQYGSLDCLSCELRDVRAKAEAAARAEEHQRVRAARERIVRPLGGAS